VEQSSLPTRDQEVENQGLMFKVFANIRGAFSLNEDGSQVLTKLPQACDVNLVATARDDGIDPNDLFVLLFGRIESTRHDALFFASFKNIWGEMNSQLASRPLNHHAPSGVVCFFTSLLRLSPACYAPQQEMRMHALTSSGAFQALK
jgi:hypothetical protein